MLAHCRIAGLLLCLTVLAGGRLLAMEPAAPPQAAGGHQPYASQQNVYPQGRVYAGVAPSSAGDHAVQPATHLEYAAATPASVVPSGSERPGAIPLSPTPARRENPLPLLPRGAAPAAGTAGGVGAFITTMGSLALVLGLFFAVAWFLRKGMPAQAALLPSEVVETLGRSPLAGRQQMQLVRCGNKLLLLCVSPAGAETLTEIIEPAEVDRLSGLCRQGHPQSATTMFRQVFQQFAREPAEPGFLGAAADRVRPAIVPPAGRRRRPLEEDDDV